MKIKFLGATQMVTGSCHLLEFGNYKVLLDCGLIQGSREQEAINSQPFEFDPSSIDAVILSHAHIDHSGRLPLLVKEGFKGEIFAHFATVDLCKIMLRDAGYLNERSIEWENRKRERKGQPLITPLFTQADAANTVNLFKGLEYDENLEVLPGLTLTLHDAGHILGSAICSLAITEHNLTKTVVYSGDLGHKGAPILKNPTVLHQADLVIMESTYGDRLHRAWDDTWQELGEVIQNARNNKGNILIPAFTVGRTQELLYIFANHFNDWSLAHWDIFLDSPMAIEATKIYSQYADVYNHQAKHQVENCGNPFYLPNLHMTPSTEESMTINKISAGAIIIAGSGMCTGGRIKQHLKHNLWRKHCHIIFVGFQARGTPGRALVDGAKQLSLWGESIQVNAKVHTIGGLSAHADQDGLTTWYQQFSNKPPLVLVHGETGAQQALLNTIQQRTQNDVKIAVHGESINLAHL